MEQNDKKTLYIAGGIGVVVVVLLVLRKGGSGQTTVVTSPPSGISDPNQTMLASKALDLDAFKSTLGSVYGLKTAQLAANTNLAQVTAQQQASLAQVQAAKDVAQLQANAQTQAIQAARDVGIAQANADTARQTMQYDAISQMQSAQNRNNLLQGLFGALGNVLKSIGAQPKPSSSGGVSGGSGGGSPTITPRITRPTLNPILPGTGFTLQGVDLGDLTAYAGGPPTIDYSQPFANDPYQDLTDFGAYAPAPYGQGTGGFYVEDPSFTNTGLYDLPFASDFGSLFGSGLFQESSPFNYDPGSGYIDIESQIGAPPDFQP